MTTAAAYKLEAPDGGWGILVCIGMAIPFISALAALPSFGLVFGDFLKGIGAGTSAIAFITSAFFCSLSFAGLFSGSLFRRWGMRRIGIIGGGFYFMGSAMQVFVTSTLQLTLAFSLLQGIGFGLMVPTSYTTFNNYFVKNRVMWMSFAQTLIGLGSMLYPVVMQTLLQLYGFRGCLLILAAINSHAILGMLLMQPVEWHMRRVPIADAELQERQPTLKVVTEESAEDDEQATIETAELGPLKNSQKDNGSNRHSTQLNAYPAAPMRGNDAQTVDSNHLSPYTMRSHPASRRVSREEQTIISSRASSITSLGNWSGPVIVSDASPQMMHSLQASRRQSVIVATTVTAAAAATIAANKKGCWQTIVDFLDLTLLKNVVYVNIVLGISFALYSDITFFTMQPVYLLELGFSKLDTATIIAIGAAADLASRIFLAITAVFIQVPSRYIYLGGAALTVLARFVFNGISDYVGMASITAIMGFLRTWLHVPLPLVFADYLPKERFATGYGLFMFLQGNIMFIIGPLVGYIRDATKSYVLTFHILNYFMLLCAGPWLLELLWVQFRRRNKIERNNVAEHNVNNLAH